MEIIEFTADIHDGIIRLPEKYKGIKRKALIKVLLDPSESKKNTIDILFKKAIRVDNIDRFPRETLHER